MLYTSPIIPDPKILTIQKVVLGRSARHYGGYFQKNQDKAQLPTDGFAHPPEP